MFNQMYGFARTAADNLEILIFFVFLLVFYLFLFALYSDEECRQRGGFAASGKPAM
jgi:hypothetical protein